MEAGKSLNFFTVKDKSLSLLFKTAQEFESSGLSMLHTGRWTS